MTDLVSALGKKGKQVEDFLEKFLTIDTHEEFVPLVLYQTKMGGKRIRPALTISFGELVGCINGPPYEQLLAAAACVELVHNYSLILDDIIDRGDVRRNKPTCWVKFSEEMALLAGMAYREAIHNAARATGSYFKQVADEIAKAIRLLIEGERLDILFEQTGRTHEYLQKKRFHEIDEADYLRMIQNKTASLLATSCKLGALVGGGTPEQVESARNFGWNIGIAFQIADDILDLTASDPKFGKPLGKDILESKLGNLPILKGLKLLATEDKEYLLSVLREDTPNKEKVQKSLEILHKVDSFELSKKDAFKYRDKALEALKEFEDSSIRDLIEKISNFIVERGY